MAKLRPLQCIAGLTLLLAATSTRAQTAPAPAAPPPAAPAAQYTEKLSLARPPVANRIAASLSAGTTLNGGNTQAYGATLGGRFQLIRDPHQVMVEALGTGAWARNVVTEEVDPTARNIVGRARYDIFLTKNDALFLALAPRRDPFAGLAIRLQTQAGYLRNLYAPADNHRLWTEVGYDYTYDLFSRFRVPGLVGPLPDTAGDHDHVHSGRLFLGYTNLLTPLLTANLGVEFLYDFQESDNNRVNTLIELTSSISQRFKLSLLSRILYDQKPVEGKEKTDYITTFQIVYTYDSFTPPDACPACDCSKDVAAAKASCAPTTSPADAVPPHEDPVAPPGPLPAQPTTTAPPVQPVQPAPQPVR